MSKEKSGERTLGLDWFGTLFSWFTKQHFRTWRYPAGAKLEVVGRLEYILLRYRLLLLLILLTRRVDLQRQIVRIVDVVIVDVGALGRIRVRLDKDRGETLRDSDGDVVERRVLVSSDEVTQRNLRVGFCRLDLFRGWRWRRCHRQFDNVGVAVGVGGTVFQRKGLLRGYGLNDRTHG